MPLILSIEGNIGSGKSTLVKNLKEYTTNKNELYKIYYLPEPVNIWETITDNSGKNILECYYLDQEKYAFSFQMMAYISRLTLLRDALKNDYDIIITERCVNTDKMVFAKMLYDSDKIKEIDYKIYNLWFDEFIKDIPNIYTIYVKTTPTVALQRVLKRARIGENISLDYLEQCHKYHEDWLTVLNSDTVLVLNGNNNIDIDNVNNPLLLEWFNQINNYIDKIID